MSHVVDEDTEKYQDQKKYSADSKQGSNLFLLHAGLLFFLCLILSICIICICILFRRVVVVIITVRRLSVVTFVRIIRIMRIIRIFVRRIVICVDGCGNGIFVKRFFVDNFSFLSVQVFCVHVFPIFCVFHFKALLHKIFIWVSTIWLK